MIIWRGLGILVVVAVALTAVLMQLIGNVVLGDYTRYSDWLFPLGLLIAAAVVWPLGRRLNGQPGRTLVDPQTGQQVTLRREHSLFFIKMEYWSPIIAIIAIALFVQALVRPG